jgi:hypothetical protein
MKMCKIGSWKKLWIYGGDISYCESQ